MKRAIWFAPFALVLVWCGRNGVSGQTLPANWVGAGAGYNPTGSPKATTWASFATVISQPQKIYSYSTYDVVPQRKAVPLTSARTGLATVLRNFGPRLYLLGFATAGVAQSAMATQSSFSGGGLLLYQWKNGMTAEAGVRVVTGSTEKVVEAGFGKSW